MGPPLSLKEHPDAPEILTVVEEGVAE